MEEKQEKADKSKQPTREELMSRIPIPGPGRSKETEGQKIVKKAIKQLVEEFKEELADALPEISPILIDKAKKGDIQAIKEIIDILIEKATRRTDLTSGGEKIQPILVEFLNGKESTNNKNP